MSTRATRTLQILTGIALGAVTAVVITLAMSASGDAGATANAGAAGGAGEYGPLLPAPYPAPPGVLTATDGTRAPVVDPAPGSVTAVFFGFTHCPDVCPATMAMAARALERLPPDDAERVRVSLVTVDPPRDTPERLERWLAGFSGPSPDSFRGFTGTEAEIREVAEAWGVYIGSLPSEPGGAYTVDHTARSWIVEDGRVVASLGAGESVDAWTRTLGAVLEGGG